MGSKCTLKAMQRGDGTLASGASFMRPNLDEENRLFGFSDRKCPLPVLFHGYLRWEASLPPTFATVFFPTNPEMTEPRDHR